ncbi:MAG: hypothetical protein COS87_02215 [Chloroflexi bacterium CG07_land_8_20_14_0_80_45_17]|nr:MAG: hypothetical protein COS87_02215 [Chloroflexi bacterium CG07_land_8_20_14_0_80_45_17]
MPINVEIKVVPFGQLRLEIGKLVPSTEKPQTFPVKEVIRYREPQETSSRIYEVQYGEKPTNYIVPLSTG